VEEDGDGGVIGTKVGELEYVAAEAEEGGGCGGYGKLGRQGSEGEEWKEEEERRSRRESSVPGGGLVVVAEETREVHGSGGWICCF
jgi:hypothetical protein